MVDARGESTLKRTQVTMFAGKGGVGKTTCAAATALHYASEEKETLAISTDATPSLSHIFALGDNTKPAKVRDLLHISELGLEEVKEMWDGKFGREVYEVFSSFVSIDYERFVEFMTSMLPGLSEEFMVDYIRELSRAGKYDAVVWDTAPLGQTLALLQTPAMLAQHLRLAPRIYSGLKLGMRGRESILAILRRWERLSQDDMEFLKNEVEFILVTIPEALAVVQLRGVFQELDNHSLRVRRLIINNVVKETDSQFWARKARQQKYYLDLLHNRWSDIPITEVPLFPHELRGLDELREVERALFSQTSPDQR